MDLKDKLTELLSRFSVSKKYVNELETICDDFAIGFKRFCESYDFDETNPTKTDKELLQIYKDIQK